MNVLIFHQYFSMPNQDGSTRMYSFVEGLNRKGHDVVIVTGSNIRRGMDEKCFHIVHKNLIIQKFRFNSKTSIISINDFYDQRLSFVKRILSFVFFSAISSLVGISIVRNVNVVFASSTPLSITIPAMFVSRTKHIPLVFEVRDLWPEAPIQLGILKNKLLILIAKFLERTAYKNAREIIGISSGISKKISKQSGKKVHLITHSVGEEFSRTHYQNNKRKDDKLTVIYAGSCGYNNAIEIFAQVAEKLYGDDELREKVDFVLIGDGPALNDLRKNTPRNLKLMGKLPKEEVVDNLCVADIALFSQRKVSNGDFKKDSLPNKFFDFIGASLPIIAGVAPGGEMDVYIKKYNLGFTTDPEDVENLYENLKKLIFNNQLRLTQSKASGALGKLMSRKTQVIKFVEIIEQAS